MFLSINMAKENKYKIITSSQQNSKLVHDDSHVNAHAIAYLPTINEVCLFFVYIN